MRFAVRHETVYRYDVPVVLGPHVLRLTPRGEHPPQARSLVVSPEPVVLRDEPDEHGNTITRVIFSGEATQVLRIESRFEVITSTPPTASDALASLPWARPPFDELGAYRPGNEAVDFNVATFAHALAADVGHHPLQFLDHLCRTMHARADKRVRTSGDARSPAETLATWQGACRDLTVLFLAVARSLGLPARFCSGYQAAAQTPDGRHYLHAWPEVFIPGAGWRGWDPTHGIPVGDGHVALCAAPAQAGTMPVAGGFSFQGPSVTSTLDFDLRITTT